MPSGLETNYACATAPHRVQLRQWHRLQRLLMIMC